MYHANGSTSSASRLNAAWLNLIRDVVNKPAVVEALVRRYVRCPADRSDGYAMFNKAIEDYFRDAVPSQQQLAQLRQFCMSGAGPDAAPADMRDAVAAEVQKVVAAAVGPSPDAAAARPAGTATFQEARMMAVLQVMLDTLWNRRTGLLRPFPQWWNGELPARSGGNARGAELLLAEFPLERQYPNEMVGALALSAGLLARRLYDPDGALQMRAQAPLSAPLPAPTAASLPTADVASAPMEDDEPISSDDEDA